MACGPARISSLSGTRWSSPQTVRCQLLPVRPQNHTLPALTGPPCNSARPPLPPLPQAPHLPPARLLRIIHPESPCHLDLTLGICSLKLVSHGGDEADLLKEERKWAVGGGDSTGHPVTY